MSLPRSILNAAPVWRGEPRAIRTVGVPPGHMRCKTCDGVFPNSRFYKHREGERKKDCISCYKLAMIERRNKP
jgi:hypothetical protein